MKEVYWHVRASDPLNEVLSDNENFICPINFRKMTKEMERKQKIRIKSFIKDSSVAIEHIWNGFIDFCRYLFHMLQEFNTDYLENEYAKLSTRLPQCTKCY